MTVVRDPESLREVVAVCQREKKFLVICHMDPDGDALGSLIALGLGLRGAGKSVTMACPNPVPECYRFLPNWEDILVNPDRLCHDPGVIITVDSADGKRLDVWGPLLKKGQLVINIDHHHTNDRFGQINWIENAAAAAELIAILFDCLGWQVTPEIALALYTGLVTDTGSFRYPNTTAYTHTQAARLLKAGANSALVTEFVYESRPVEGVQLLAKALDSLQLSAEGRIAWLTVLEEDLIKTGATAEVVNGLVNYARSIAGVEVGILFQQVVGGSVKVSLRSRAKIDVSAIAAQFGGGGHPRAAGCRVRGSVAEVETAILGEVKRAVGG